MKPTNCTDHTERWIVRKTRRKIDTGKPHKLDDGGNPTPAALLEMAGALHDMHRMGVELNMRAKGWSAPYGAPCGSACHAGAFALAAGIPYGWSISEPTSARQRAADSLAIHIGFSSRAEYKVWAARNPEIWGNGCGSQMFTGAEAFMVKDDRRRPCDITLRDIAAHYLMVAERLFT